MQLEADVAIVGAGPSGAWCAWRLAREGARVLLFDSSHPREKPCGGGVTGRALTLVAPALGGNAPEARDFTDYATPAAPGNVEIWLAGTPTGGARAAAVPSPRRTAPSTPRSAPDDTPFQMPGVIAPAPTRAEQVERILIERFRQGR